MALLNTYYQLFSLNPSHPYFRLRENSIQFTRPSVDLHSQPELKAGISFPISKDLNPTSMNAS